MPQLSGPVYSAHEEVTVSTAVKSLTAATYGNKSYAFITVEDNSVRYRVDGGNPAAGGIGHLVSSGDIIKLTSHAQIVNFRAIREGAADGVLQVSYGD